MSLQGMKVKVAFTNSPALTSTCFVCVAPVSRHTALIA
jgi:hypothetical protein